MKANRARKRALNVNSKNAQSKARMRKGAKKRIPPHPPTRNRAWNLGTLPAVRRRLAAVVTDLDHKKYRSELGLSRARTMIYGLSTIAGILKTESELEILERIAGIEERLKALRGGTA